MESFASIVIFARKAKFVARRRRVGWRARLTLQVLDYVFFRKIIEIKRRQTAHTTMNRIDS